MVPADQHPCPSLPFPSRDQTARLGAAVTPKRLRLEQGSLFSLLMLRIATGWHHCCLTDTYGLRKWPKARTVCSEVLMMTAASRWALMGLCRSLLLCDAQWRHLLCTELMQSLSSVAHKYFLPHLPTSRGAKVHWCYWHCESDVCVMWVMRSVVISTAHGKRRPLARFFFHTCMEEARKEA